MNIRWRDFGIAGAWLLLDQLTKLWASSSVFVEPLVVIPGFLRFAVSHNRGALFGWLAGAPDPWRTMILTGLPVIAIAALVVLLLRTSDQEQFARVGLALILGGAIGNVLDRLIYHHVVDFIDVFVGWEPAASWLARSWVHTNRWPTFNVADSGLVCGVSLLLYEVFVRRPRTGEETVGAPLAD